MGSRATECDGAFHALTGRVTYILFFWCAAVLLAATLVFPFSTFASVKLDIPSLPLHEKLEKKGFEAPLNPVIPAIEGMEITWARFRRYEEVKFRVDKQKLEAEGRYWKFEYKPRGERVVDTFAVAAEYRKMLEQRAATVSMGRKGRYFLFEAVVAEHKYTGKFSTRSDSISIEMVETDVFNQTLKVNPDQLREELMSNGKVTLEGIYFDFDKATLQSHSNRAIHAAAVLMRKYPDLELEVQGHTDAKGSAEYNTKLSQRRAASVVDAIVKEGVAKERLTPKGLGQTQPVASNEDEAGRAKNRRVELHRVRGGESKALISIDFIKPIPGAVEKQRWHYDHEEHIIRFRKPHAEKRSQINVVGSVDRIQWQFETYGKIDRSVSAKEIIKNYLSVLETLGAKITAVEKHSLYFYLADRGDGREAYGVVRTDSSGTYQISFILPEQNTESSSSNSSQQEKQKMPAGEQDVSRDLSISSPNGKWFFDEKTTRVQASPAVELRQYSGLTVELAEDGALYYYGSRSGKWKLEENRLVVSQDGKSWKAAPIQMAEGRLVMRDGELQLYFSRSAPVSTVETAEPVAHQLSGKRVKNPWTVDSVNAHMSGIEKLQYAFENVHNIQDTRIWNLKREGEYLMSRLYSKNQAQFIDSDWVYFDTKAVDAAVGPLISSGLRTGNKAQVVQVNQAITVPAGEFSCTKIYTRDRFDRPVEAWLIDSMPGIPAKILTHDASYQLERIYP